MKSVLIADDEQQSMQVFHAALSSAGYDVQIAENGKTVLELTKDRTFDMIIVDEMMPDMSGNDVITKLKENEATKNVPIIVLTNYGEEELIKTAMAHGASDYVLKYQMTPSDLTQKVKSFIGE